MTAFFEHVPRTVKSVTPGTGTNYEQINNSKDLTCTYLNTSSPGGASVRIEEHCSQVQDDLFHSVCALDIRYNTKEMFILNNF